MNKEEAISIIEQALNAATIKGIYSLSDVQAILLALEELKK
jgi:ferric-dicitrate binding protein FerR (iron transport regulator)